MGHDCVRPSCQLHPQGLAPLGPVPSPGRWEPSPGWVITRNALQTLYAGVPRNWVLGLPALLNGSQRQPLLMLPATPSFLLSPLSSTPWALPARVLTLSLFLLLAVASVSLGHVLLSGSHSVPGSAAPYLASSCVPGEFLQLPPRSQAAPALWGRRPPHVPLGTAKAGTGLFDAWGPHGPLLSWEAVVRDPGVRFTWWQVSRWAGWDAQPG